MNGLRSRAGISPAETKMYSETREAPEAAARALDGNRDRISALVHKLRERKFRAVVTAARGSSDNAATYAHYLIETRLGILTSSAAPSISSVYSAPPDLTDTALLAISQSGKSPDLLSIVEAARKVGAYVIAIVNDEASPLANLADCCLPMYAGPERSVAATKSYLTSAVLIAELVAAWGCDEMLETDIQSLPHLMEQAWQCDWSAAIDALTDAGDLYVVGRGVGFGAAQEAALKFKETCALHAEAFSAAEVRHGPMALVQTGFPTFVLAQDDATRDGIAKLVESFVASKANVILAGVRDPRALSLPYLPANPVLQPILLMQSFYRLACGLSCARGQNPDTPPHLNKVTETV